jgi:hypothetical protein
MPPLKFKVKLLGRDDIETAYFHAPFDVPNTFGTKARVPVKGTINKFPFRSSLMNMGEGHCMVVNRQLREGAKVKAGDIVNIVMEQDTAKRVVTVPKYLKQIIGKNKTAASAWSNLSYTCQKEYVLWLEDAKKPETRERRIQKVINALYERANKQASSR